jgi:AAA domain
MVSSADDFKTNVNGAGRKTKYSRDKEIIETAKWLAAREFGNCKPGEEEAFIEEAKEIVRKNGSEYDDSELTDQGYKNVKTYPYTTAAGDILYEVCRYERPDIPGAKKFRQRRLNGFRYVADAGLVKIPYRLPELIKRPDETVYYVEGEKGADRLHSLGFLATTMAGQNWSPEAVKFFRGRDVVIIPDNDEPGQKHEEEARKRLQPVAKSVRSIRLPDVGYGGDVSDWFEVGHTAEELSQIVGKARPVGINASLFELPDEQDIPQRQWLYKTYYCRDQISMTVAESKMGKSLLVIRELLMMVTAYDPWNKNQPDHKKLRCWYWNGEDPRHELMRRFFATAKRYGITREQIGDRLYVDSGQELPIVIAHQDNRSTRIATPVKQEVIATLKRNKIDVLVIDPFITCHRVTENSTDAIELVMQAWMDVAIEANCSIMLVHHTKKMRGNEAGVDDARGAYAAIAKARVVRVLNRMTTQEAAQAEIEERERHRYFRMDTSGNLGPAEESDWYVISPEQLQNGPFKRKIQRPGSDEIVDWKPGDVVGVVVPWSFPKTDLQSITQEQWTAALDSLRTGGPWRADSKSQMEPWAGIPIAEALDLDLMRAPHKKAVRDMIRDWTRAGRLKEVSRKGPDRKTHQYIEVAPVRSTVAE